MFLFYGYEIYYLIRLPDNKIIYKKIKILGHFLKNIFIPFFLFELKKKNTTYKLLAKSRK
jgi:hypothetical protein